MPSKVLYALDFACTGTVCSLHCVACVMGMAEGHIRRCRVGTVWLVALSTLLSVATCSSWCCHPLFLTAWQVRVGKAEFHK